MKTIKLYGDLARFKPEWSLNVKTVSEAMRAIEANRPGFIAYADQGDYVLVLVDENNHQLIRQVTQNNALEAWANEELWVIPKPRGEVVAAGAAIVIAGISIGVGSAVTAFILAVVINIAIAIAISFISTLIAGTNDGMSSADSEPYDSKPSYLMNGVVNTTRQGHRIPLLYGGPLLVGSMVLSADILTKDVPV